MALSSIPHRNATSGSIFDPLFNFSMIDPAQFFHDSEHSQQFAKDMSAVANTRVDWVETADAHVFKADLPGLSKDEIKIQVEPELHSLQISGERRKEAVDKGDKYHRVERAHGAFLRRFRLPENANLDVIKAEVLNGVLTVTVPKTQQPKPQVRSIKIE